MAKPSVDHVNHLSNFTNWKDIEFRDVAIAYRKAKSDCFWERSVYATEKFALFESNLLDNLTSIHQKLKAGEIEQLLAEPEHVGSWYLLPKKMEFSGRDEHTDSKGTGTESTAEITSNLGANAHLFISDAKREVDRQMRFADATAEFRTMGDFSVAHHVVSSLWVNRVGHLLDDCLSSDIYGSRVRRYRSRTEPAGRPAGYNALAFGTFEPYVFPYMRWRSNGMTRIRRELEDNRDVIAITLDLKSYYHAIDPRDILDRELFRGLKTSAGDQLQLSTFEQKFTESVVDALVRWQELVRDQAKLPAEVSVGVPLGHGVSRIIANILLWRWDSVVRRDLSPLYYGRYVDDMLIVLADPGRLDSFQKVDKFLRQKLAKALEPESDDGCWKIGGESAPLKYSCLTMNHSKSRVFSLSGRSGLDFVSALDAVVQEISSERRLLPDPAVLAGSPAARLLTTSAQAGDDADSLRRANGLQLRRLAWSVTLRNVETLAADLPASAWAEQRGEYHRFAFDHLLRIDSLLAAIDALPRLLGLAIQCGDWVEAGTIVRKVIDIGAQFKRLCEHRKSNSDARLPTLSVLINGRTVDLNTFNVAGAVSEVLRRIMREAAIRSWWSVWDDRSVACVPRVAQKVLALFVLPTQGKIAGVESIEEFVELSARAFAADLSNRSWLAALVESADTVIRLPDPELIPRFPNLQIDSVVPPEQATDIQDFLYGAAIGCDSKTTGRESAWDAAGLLFATRRIHPTAIAKILPQVVAQDPTMVRPDGLPVRDADKGGVCGGVDETGGHAAAPIPNGDLVIDPDVLWARMHVALRGVAIDPEDFRRACSVRNSCRPEVDLGATVGSDPVVAVANAITDEKEWDAAAKGRPQLSVERYRRVAGVVNQAIRSDALSNASGPKYLILPELYLPRRWVASTANRLLAQNISLIAGVEYRTPRAGVAENSVCMVLTDHRLGFPASVAWMQPKLVPAPREGYLLERLHGRQFPLHLGNVRTWPPVIRHGGLCFAVLICSELQNVRHRARLRGRVDALLVPAWNKDIGTFASLVEAAALDVHGFVVVANNRLYGDSRARSPAKKEHARDLCLIKGGLDDHVVVVELPVAKLREFQGHARPWPEESDPFKPVPDGFVVAPWRRSK